VKDVNAYSTVLTEVLKYIKNNTNKKTQTHINSKSEIITDYYSAH